MATTLTNGRAHKFQVIHELPGRLRLRLNGMRNNRAVADSLEAVLLELAGVQSVRINIDCGSVLIEYEDDKFEPLSWFQRLDLQSLPPVQRSRRPHKPSSFLGGLLRATFDLEARIPPKVQLGLSACAMGLSLAGAPVVLLRAATALAIAPMINRALQLVLDEGRLGSDALDGASCMVLMYSRRFPAATFMAFLVALGELMRDQITVNCQRMIAHQLDLGRQSAWKIKGNGRVRVPIWELKTGDRVVVYPGELISITGTVYAGDGMIVPSTPEIDFQPVHVKEGAKIEACTVLTEGKLYMINEQPEMCLVIDPAREKQTRRWFQRNRLNKRALRLAYSTILPVLGIAATVYAFTRDLQRSMAIVCFDFITGIKIAIPVAVLSSMYNAGRKGIVIRNASALENLAEVDAIIFARSGALTKLHPKVTDVFVCEGFELERAMRAAAAVVQRYNHLAAHAIYSYANVHEIPVPERTSSEWIDGLAVAAEVEGQSVLVGSTQVMRERHIDLLPAKEFLELSARRGDTRACIVIDGKLAAVIAFFDPIRPEAAEVVAELKLLGISEIAVMSSGGQVATEIVARNAGIDTVHFRTTPEQQAEIVRSYKERGLRVAVVGYDAAHTLALEQADVAISMGVSADIARHRSDVVLTSDNLEGLADGIIMARKGMNLARQNMFLTAVPNFFGLSLSLLNRAEFLAATLMNNGTTIVAAANGLRPLLEPGAAGDEQSTNCEQVAGPLA